MKVRFISVCDNYDSFAPGAKAESGIIYEYQNLVNDAYAKTFRKERAAKRIAQKKW